MTIAAPVPIPSVPPYTPAVVCHTNELKIVTQHHETIAINRTGNWKRNWTITTSKQDKRMAFIGGIIH